LDAARHVRRTGSKVTDDAQVVVAALGSPRRGALHRTAAAGARRAPVEPRVFIGERLSIEPYTLPCTLEPMGSDRGCILMDEPCTARYRRVQTIVGAPDGKNA